MSETTILEKRPVINTQSEKDSNSGAWKQVTLGGVTGILMGAGLMYAGQATAATFTEQQLQADSDVQIAEQSVKVAQQHDELPFGEAFDAARAEVGPGGVFHWHGGVYNTYTADEWNAMTSEQKQKFAQHVQTEVDANHVSTPTDDQPEVVAQPEVPEEVQVVDDQVAANFEPDGDVHIVGYANVEGHLAVGYDIDGDGEADVAIIDVDGDFKPSDADIIMDREGNMSTLGELNQHQDPSQMVAMENPDVAPDMPDYMNDVIMDA